MNQTVAMRDKKLCIFLTAGFPRLDSMPRLIGVLEEEGVDYVEIGMPYSDPLADGLTIQQTSKAALENGMKMDLLFAQLKEIRDQTHVPLIYMGYLNPVLKYGVEKFIDEALGAGIVGCILPDLPMELYAETYRDLFNSHGLGMNFLVSPGTSEERIRMADRLSDQYLYIISQNTITGTPKEAIQTEGDFYHRLNAMDLTSEKLIGFGISDRAGVERAYRYADGAIIGSAFLKAIGGSTDPENAARQFIRAVKP